MKLATLINGYLYTIDAFDVYDNDSGKFLYTTEEAANVGLGIMTRIKHFSIYETEEKTVFELYI